MLRMRKRSSLPRRTVSETSTGACWEVKVEKGFSGRQFYLSKNNFQQDNIHGILNKMSTNIDTKMSFL